MSIDVETLSKIARGNDSCVYLDGDTVYKKYFNLPRAEIARYAELVNRSVSVINQCSYAPRIEINGTSFDIRFHGHPVLDVMEGGDGCPIITAAYLPSPNLDKLSQAPELYDEFAKALPLGHKESEFLTSLNRLFHAELPTRTLDEFHYHIDILSRILDRELGTFGIYIGKYNTKISPRLEATRLTFEITDLSVYLERLRYE